MSGKVKKKGTGFSYKNVDLTRFAYDVIRYTALKFRVPESAIAVMEGSSNDYGTDDYLSVVCAQVMDSQIKLRYRINIIFRKHFEINRLASPELISKLIQEVMDNTLELGFIAVVVATLAAVCELFLFLYSENADLCPVELATFWIQCYLNLNKKEFEDAGGLKELYDYSRFINLNNMDAFLNSFIDEHCLSYENSSKIETLQVTYVEKLLNLPDEFLLSSKEEVKLPSPSVESSLDPSAATLEKQQCYLIYETPMESRKRLNSRLLASTQHDLGLSRSDSSEEKQSNVSVLKGTTPSYRLLGARPKTYGESSSHTDMPSPCPNVEQGSGQPSSDSSGAEQSRK